MAQTAEPREASEQADGSRWRSAEAPAAVLTPRVAEIHLVGEVDGEGRVTRKPAASLFHRLTARPSLRSMTASTRHGFRRTSDLRS
jgi:hypothetical protein